LDESGTLGYTSPFFKIGDVKYFRDFNIEIGHKFSQSFKLLFTYVYEDYNIDVIEGHTGEPLVHADIFVADMTYKITPTKAIRLETQALITKEDEGDWFMGIARIHSCSQMVCKCSRSVELWQRRYRTAFFITRW
jgi:lipopolysaccharide assembly outer membrane protein LptD (OstA)